MPEASDTADLWRLTVQHSPIGMALVDLDGRLLTVNHAFCTMLGHSAETLVRLSFADLTHPDDIDDDLGVFRRAAAGEIDTFRLRKRYLHADGHVVWGDLSVALVRNQDGGPRHLISQILDVTAQRDREERLELARLELERGHHTLGAVFEAVSVGLLLISNEGHYERMNRRHAETMSLPFPDGHDGEAGQLGAVYLADGKTLMGKGRCRRTARPRARNSPTTPTGWATTPAPVPPSRPPPARCADPRGRGWARRWPTRRSPS